MKYQFECEEIKSCQDCPCSAWNDCNPLCCITGQEMNQDEYFKTIQPSCQLVEVKEKKNKGDFVDGIYMP